MRYLVVLKQVFNWYAKAGVRVLGAMPEAEAEVAVPHLLERDGDVFLLFYAGHGTSSGALCMQDGYITFEDLVNAWVGFDTDMTRALTEEQRAPMLAEQVNWMVLVDWMVRQ